MSMAEFYTALVSICQLRYLKWNCRWSSNQSLILTTVIYLFVLSFLKSSQETTWIWRHFLIKSVIIFHSETKYWHKLKIPWHCPSSEFCVGFLSYTVKIESKQLIILPCLLIVHLVQNCAFSPHLTQVKKIVTSTL